MITKFSTSKLSYTQRYRQMMAGAAYIPTYGLISTQLISTAAASVTFSGIDQSFRHLQIVIASRSTANGVNAATINMTLNGDTGANYASHLLGGNGSTTFSQNNTSQSAILAVCDMGAGTTGGPEFSPAVIDILDYNKAKNKTVRGFSGTNGAAATYALKIKSGLWMSTNAITSFTLTPNTGSFEVGSRISVYGVVG